jgi:hypothetical protein
MILSVFQHFIGSLLLHAFALSADFVSVFQISFAVAFYQSCDIFLFAHVLM